jgi:dTDP-4-dehydrorhamnose reductase
MTAQKSKLLVTGISGFLGSYLAEVKNDQWDIHGFYNHSRVEHPRIKTSQVDLLDLHQLRSALEALQPDAVLHLAAQSNPNYCEEHPAFSHRVNVEVTKRLAEYCAIRSLPLVFVSSDLVFDGASAPYIETDTCIPISIYGQHKMEAEEVVLHIHPDACVARCPVMYGLPRWGNSFMSNWIKALSDGRPVYAFKDEYRTKIDGLTAVEGLLLLLNKGAQGIYHLGGKNRISRYDFAVLMAKVFDLSTELVIPSLRADVKMPAARPADVSLLSEKAYDLGFAPIGIKESLRRIKATRLL